MTLANIGCSCSCNPCRCGNPAPPCLADLCQPRPCFFSGQLVTADDLNAIVSYFRSKDLLLAKLVAGWGVLGGMRLLQPGARSFRMFTNNEGISPSPPSPSPPPPELRCIDSLLPNPQIVPGPIATLTAGAAIDAAGRTLTLCGPRSVDVLALSAGMSNPPVTKTCSGWFGEFCAHLPGQITASQYWVVAELAETPARPVPQYSGASACATGPNCDYSRVFEDVQIRLVKDLPLLYFLHGCLENVPIPCVDELIALLGSVIDIPNVDAALSGVVTSDVLAYLTTNAGGTSKTANDAIVEAFGCVGFKFVPQLLEFVNSVIANTCCSTPGVVLGRVLLATEVPTEVRNALGDSAYYLFLDDAFPYRRLIPNAAMYQTWMTTLLSIAVCLSERGRTGT